MQRKPARIRDYWPYACFLAMVAWAYWPTLEQIARTWISDPDYTHGFLVIPLVWGIACRRRESLADPAMRPSVAGLVLVALAALMRIAAARFYILELDHWSIPVWIGGLIWTLGGWQWFRCLAPAVGFLAFALPLPATIERGLSLPLQQVASATSAWILQCFGQSAVSAGTTLLVGPDVFEIERACSGLRMFLGTFAMAVAYFLLSSTRLSIRLGVLLAAMPVAVLTNALRIVCTAVLHEASVHALTRRLVHDLTGLLMVAVAWLAYWMLGMMATALVSWWERDRRQFARWSPALPAFMILLACALFFWHHRQKSAMYEGLLGDAARYEGKQQWLRAAQSLERAARLQPGDADVLARLAQAMSRSTPGKPGKRQALTLLTAASRANPESRDYLFQRAELAWELHRPAEVLEASRAYLANAASGADDGHQRQLVVRWQAASLYELMNTSSETTAATWKDVADALTRAVEEDPGYAVHAFRLASVCRDRLTSPSAEERARRADRVMDEMVSHNGTLAEAYLLRYRYRRQYAGAMQVASTVRAAMDADLDRAVELAKGSKADVEVLVAAAERMRERGEVEASRAAYEEASRIEPRDARPYLALASIASDRGDAESRGRAAETLQRGLAALGDQDRTLLLPLIELLIQLDRSQEADARIAQARQAIELAPAAARATYALQLEHVLAWRVARVGDFGKAADQLSAAVTRWSPDLLAHSRPQVARSWSTVGQYFQLAGDWKQAAGAYQRATALDEMWRLEYRWALARLAESEGRNREAAEQFGQAAEDATDPFEAWIKSAAADLRQQMLLAAPLRDWTHFRRSLDSARVVAGPRLDEVVVLEANSLLAQGQADQALELLRQACGDFPQSARVRRSLALLQGRQGDLEAALATADQLPSPTGDASRRVLLRHHLLLNGQRFADARREVQHAIDAGSCQDMVGLQVALARLDMQEGHWPEARERLMPLASDSRRDVRVLETLGQLAWCQQDWALLEECEAGLRSMEGNAGSRWRALRIRRVLAQADQLGGGRTGLVSGKVDEAALRAEAGRLARELETLHPARQQTRIARGTEASYQGSVWQAVASFEEAWELGLPRVSLAVDLVTLLNELGDTERAQRYVRETRQYLAASEQFLDEALKPADSESALESLRMAEAMARERGDGASYLRLGRTLVLTTLPGRPESDDRLQRAEKAFREAVRVAPGDTRAWAALFRYLVAVRPDVRESQELLDALAAREDIPALERAFVLAQLNESIGNTEQASQRYREAIQLAEKQEVAEEQVLVLERAAQYFVHIEPSLAESCCRAALKLQPAAIGPSLVLIRSLLDRDTPAAVTEAEKRVRGMEPSWRESDQGKRLFAEVLLRVATRNEGRAERVCREATALLDGVDRPTSLDGLLRSELHLLGNDRGAAMNELRSVSRDLPRNAGELVRYLREHGPALRNDPRFRLVSERILDQLELLPEWDLLALDVRIELARKDEGKAAAQRGTPQWGSLETSLLSEFARRRLERESDPRRQARDLMRLMRHLVDTGRGEQAFRVLALVTDVAPRPIPEIAFANALALARPDAPALSSLVDHLDHILRSHPSHVDLGLAAANVFLLHGDVGRAEELLRECVRLQPDHALALNNLALTLAVQPDGNETEIAQLLGEALRAKGRHPMILDTWALVHLLRGESQQAVDLLLEAIPQSDASAPMFLHLAAAWNALGDSDKARFALTMARSRGIESGPMLEVDREMLRQLHEQLNKVSL
jgi:exosortase